MRSRELIALGVALVICVVPCAAIAEMGPKVRGNGTGFKVSVKKSGGGNGAGTGPVFRDPGTWSYVPVCGLGGIDSCHARTSCGDRGELNIAYYTPPGGIPERRGEVCLGGDTDAPEAARPQITNVMVLRALRRIPVPAAKLVVQPPGGKTLVNFETIFHTKAEPFNRTVTLLGQRVELEITPSAFVWKHGDNTSQTTSTPGVAFAEGRPMSDYITHAYDQAHKGLKPSVDTTYSARFRVNGGAWREVVGTVTIVGDPVDLQVVEGRPALVNAH